MPGLSGLGEARGEQAVEVGQQADDNGLVRLNLPGPDEQRDVDELPRLASRLHEGCPLALDGHEVGGSAADAAPPRVRRFVGLSKGEMGNEGRLRLAPVAAAARVAIAFARTCPAGRGTVRMATARALA